MAIYTKLNKSDLKKFLCKFQDVPTTTFTHKGVGMGTVNTYYRIAFKNQVFFLKIDEVGDEKRLKNEIAVFENLKKHEKKLSYSFPFPIKTLKGKYYFKYKNKFVLLFPELKGKAIFKGLTVKHLHTVGAKMAELHKMPLNKNVKPHRFTISGIQSAHKGIEQKLKQKHPELNHKIKNTLKDLANVKKIKLCLIHADIFPENIHWKNGKFFGLLDFEAAGLGNTLYDLCMAIHAFCSGRNNRIDQKKAKALISGYESIRRLNRNEKKHFNDYLLVTALRVLTTRLRDFELKKVRPKEENFKDYREFSKRLDEVYAMHQNLWFN